jgi:hypothetical protein
MVAEILHGLLNNKNMRKVVLGSEILDMNFEGLGEMIEGDLQTCVLKDFPHGQWGTSGPVK